MKKIKLTKEERLIEKDFENDSYKSVSNLSSEKKKYRIIARNTLKKNKSITIRLAERDLQKIKTRAAQEGIPYQTFLTSVIHKNIY